jgi:deoxyribose-phosphate aldolase
MVSMARMMISDANSNVEIGTVIDFPEGKDWGCLMKIQAIQDDADDLDFVCNYEGLKKESLI